MSIKIKRFIDCYIPTEVCNFKCSYCYIGQREGFTGNIYKIDRTPNEVRKALSRKRFGGTMFLNFCAGGETLLNEEVLDIVYELLLEGHIVQIVTNGTITERFKRIAKWDKEILDRLFVKFSFHYLELVRLGLLEVFFDNIQLIKSEGVSISLEITPCDEMIPYIDDMKKISTEKLGAIPHVTVARNVETTELKVLSSLSKEEYINIWKTFESPMFDLKMKLLSEKRCEYCYGGEWTFYLNLKSGDLKQCYKGDVIDNIYLDENAPIHFKPIGKKCREAYCFNGHAWLTWGAIPNMDLPTYADMRNRIEADGGEWLSESVKEAFSCKLEDTNIVYDNTDDVPKVLFLGDSILEGYIPEVRRKLESKVYIYYNNEISRFSTYLYRYIHEWANEMKIGSNIDVVHFNVGLWDITRLNDEEPCIDIETYRKNLKRICREFDFIFPNAKLIFSTTTPVKTEEWYQNNYRLSRKNEDIKKYNAVAIEIMKECNVIVNDLWQISKYKLKDEYIDTTHFTEGGYKILGENVAKSVLEVIDKIECRKEVKTFLKNDEYRNNLDLLKEHRIIVYGCGDYGKKVINKLKECNIKPYLILDRNKKMQNTKFYDTEILSPESYASNLAKEGDLIIIAVQNRGVWNNIIPLFEECNDIDICAYTILGIE